MALLTPEKKINLSGKKASNQDLFDKFIINAMKIIHDPKVISGLLEEIKLNSDTVDGVGEAAFEIIRRLEESAGGSQVSLTANVIMNGINVIVGELIEIIETAGANKLNAEQKYQAVAYTISKYLDYAVKAGKISKEELIRVSQMMQNNQLQGSSVQKPMQNEQNQNISGGV